MDTVSKKQRSQIMRLVRSKDTKLEIKFSEALKQLGYKFRKNVSNYFGKPDIVLPRFKTVVFVDSCFWHRCKRHCRLPSSRRTYWVRKIERNQARDAEVNKYYKKLGWNVARFWEHEIKKDSNKCIKKLRLQLN